MKASLPSFTSQRSVLLLLVLVALAAGVWDCVAVSIQYDTFLPPPSESIQTTDGVAERTAVRHVPGEWQAAALRWASRYLSDGVLVVAIVLAVHLLLWGGVYSFGLSAFGGSPWIALLAVVLARIAPDLFQVRLLSAESPARLLAIALAFWSVAFTIRRRWVAACVAAALIAHFSPTVACWFAQFIVVALVSLYQEWGWRKSLVGAVCYLAIAAGPITWFVLTDIVPDPPLAGDAMMGLAFFANPNLSPFSVPLWAYACLTIYLAMSLGWLKRCFDRRSIPVVIIFFLFGVAGILLEIIFVCLLPMERATRFDLQNMRAFWFLWIAILYAPVLAGELRAAWKEGTAFWRPVFQALAFSAPVVWTVLTVLARLRRPPRWASAVALPILALIVLTAFVLPHGGRPLAEPSFALATAVVLTVAVGVTALVRYRSDVRMVWLARSLGAATGLFALVLLILDGHGLTRTVSQTRDLVVRDKAWAEACRWAAEHSPADSKWSVPWRPRQFQRRTGRAVLVNRQEIPQDPGLLLEWFRSYAETHEWAGGLGIFSAGWRGGEEALAEPLREYRQAFFMGAARRLKPSDDCLVVSPALLHTYGVRYAICDRDRPPRFLPERGGMFLERLHVSGPFEIYELGSEANRPASNVPPPKSEIANPKSAEAAR